MTSSARTSAILRSPLRRPPLSRQVVFLLTCSWHSWVPPAALVAAHGRSCPRISRCAVPPRRLPTPQSRLRTEQVRAGSRLTGRRPSAPAGCRDQFDSSLEPRPIRARRSDRPLSPTSSGVCRPVFRQLISPIPPQCEAPGLAVRMRSHAVLQWWATSLEEGGYMAPSPPNADRDWSKLQNPKRHL